MKLEATQRLRASARKVVLLYSGINSGGEVHLEVTDTTVWAVTADRKTGWHLANLMFNSKGTSTPTAQADLLTKTALNAIHSIPDGENGYAEAVLKAVAAVTRLPQRWSIVQSRTR
jgi:hypothetical protein